MNKGSQRICTWSGPVGLVLFGGGLQALAGFVPPPSPAESAEAIAALYHGNQLGIQLGAILTMIGASIMLPFFVMFAVLLKRIEGRNTPYAYTTLVGGAMVSTFIFIGAMLFAVAAFRPERAIETTQTLNDFAWIMFVSPGAPGFVQTVAIGLGILSDKASTPVFPRWSGYFSLWVALMFMPAELAVVMKTGPFAWNGFLAFWVPVVLVGIWFAVMTWLMLKAITAETPASAADHAHH